VTHTLSTPGRYALALLIIGLTLVVRLLMAPLWETTAPFALFMFATVITAAYCGVGPALLTGVAGFLTRLYFDSPIVNGVIAWEEIVRLGLFICFVVGTTIVLNRLRIDRLQLETSMAAAQRELQERRRVETALESARAGAEAANRLKDEFLALVSHELRTPINAILGWVTLLRNGALPLDRSMYALEIIHKNAKTQAQLVTDLLDIAHGLTGQFQLESRAVELNTLLRSAVDASRDAADARRLTLWVSLAPEHLVVWGDPARVDQIITHLLSNAIKFTPEGGEVGVTLARRDSSAELVVTDTGEGIEPEFEPYLFEPFRQADTGATRRYGGLGLGLALVRQLVELHGGTVTGEAMASESGARFTVRLPLHEADAVNPLDTGREVQEAELASRSSGLETSVEINRADAALRQRDPRVNREAATN
jgi:signal transduction histidine kinase